MRGADHVEEGARAAEAPPGLQSAPLNARGPDQTPGGGSSSARRALGAELQGGVASGRSPGGVQRSPAPRWARTVLMS
jgi:hypothetical protein